MGPRSRRNIRFQTAGTPTLAELFDGRSQLVIYNFMFGPDYEAGCPVCSSIADSFNGVLEHLKARDVTMICVSRAPLEKLLAYRQRMGWNFNWASSYESDFNFDFERSVSRETVASWFERRAGRGPGPAGCRCGTDAIRYMSEGPGLSVFALSDGDVYLTYSSTARGLEPVMVYYGILDRVPTAVTKASRPIPRGSADTTSSPVRCGGAGTGPSSASDWSRDTGRVKR